MSYTFTKLFSSITSSTVWMEPSGTRLVWIAMLANCDRKGRVFASLPGLAHLSRVTMEEAELAIQTFLAPDPHSRTADHEGRRIEPIDGGWQLLNHAKYREIRDEETIRESKRAHMQRKRAEQKSGSDDSTNDTVDPVGSKQKQKQIQEEPPVVPLEGDKPARAPRETRAPKATLRAWLESLPEGEAAIPGGHAVFAMAKNAGIPKGYLAIAWHVFRADHIDKLDKRQIDWRATFQNYVRHNYLKLWRTSEAGYDLTDKGIQAERELKGASNGA